MVKNNLVKTTLVRYSLFSVLRVIAIGKPDPDLNGNYLNFFLFIQGLNNKKTLPAGSAMLHCLENIAAYMEALTMDVPSNLWIAICSHFQTFLTKLPAVLPVKVTLNRVADSSMTAMCPMHGHFDRVRKF